MLIGVEGEGGDYQKLHRVEVAALLTTAAKMAHAVEIVNRFEKRRLGSAGFFSQGSESDEEPTEE